MCQPLKYSHNVGKDQTAKQLNLFGMTKESLIKKIHILTHELSIHYRYEQKRQELLKQPEEEIRMELVEKEIVIEQMKKNELVLQNCIKEKSRTIEQLAQEKIEQQLVIKNLRRESELINKKIGGMEKTKNKEITQKIDQIQKNVQGKMDALLEENKKMKASTQEMRHKIKILTDLNAQTEDKLAEVLTEAIKNNSPTQAVNKPYQSKENMNPNRKDYPLQENSSLRQQIRKVRAQLKDCQQAKQRLRHKLKERQQFYSKMLASKSIQS